VSTPPHSRPPEAAAPALSPGSLAAPLPTEGADETRYRGPDRRRRPTPRFSRYTLWGGRRRGGRRAGETEGIFVDQYSRRLLLVMLWIALMNAGDSFFTLLHLQSGGIELNPVAAAMLETGRFGFVVIKSLVITIPLIVLTLHKSFPLARIGIWTAAAAYTALLVYHVSLL
jgi:hypothetical protein